MSQSQPSPMAKPKLIRDPPPALFLGPPSQNASQLSLPGTLNPLPNPGNSAGAPLNPSSAMTPLVRQRTKPSTTRSPLQRQRTASIRRQNSSEGQKQAARTDALWAEMQSTLDDVELSAVNGTHVFGPEHSRSLEELRTAQIGLAQAWARSEADNEVDEGGKLRNTGGGLLGTEGRSTLDGPGEGTDGTRTGPASASARPSSSSGMKEQMGGVLEEETKADIVLARKRREANDRYFETVNAGVLDVVAKLEEVAAAMRSVEQESRDIWGETESLETGASGMTG